MWPPLAGALVIVSPDDAPSQWSCAGVNRPEPHPADGGFARGREDARSWSGTLLRRIRRPTQSARRHPIPLADPGSVHPEKPLGRRLGSQVSIGLAGRREGAVILGRTGDGPSPTLPAGLSPC